eukprot:scaffold2659_cov107-Cylindrotheca_fusiformis.AAC.5
MLNARVEIDTEKIPYKVKRKMPSFLDPYFEEHIQWITFCDNLDHRLRPYEHIKAAWTIIGAIFTLLLIGFIVGIFCSILVVDDPGQSSVLAVSLAGGLVATSCVYLCLMQLYVIRPLKVLGQSIEEYCETVGSKWETVEFHFERSSKYMESCPSPEDDSKTLAPFLTKPNSAPIKKKPIVALAKTVTALRVLVTYWHTE